MTRSHRFVAAGLLVLAGPLFLGACSDDDTTVSADQSSSTTTTTPPAVNTGPTVEVVGLAFSPTVETVTVGETVTWVNTGNSPHTVTPRPLPDGSLPFESTQIDPGVPFVQTFNTAGDYPYFCSIHPDRMTGSIVVEPA